jgi:hypothetical protein
MAKGSNENHRDKQNIKKKISRSMMSQAQSDTTAITWTKNVLDDGCTSSSGGDDGCTSDDSQNQSICFFAIITIIAVQEVSN